MLHKALVEIPHAEASSFCVKPFCFLMVLMAVPISMAKYQSSQLYLLDVCQFQIIGKLILNICLIYFGLQEK